ncbi:MAG: phosphodiester glycosidase family protein [Candidatus Cohnella colombiensis]|uniref:Phosphodiester glycosidase family protein n=1 Tax=Candidatus Cohnella colombiensis TaxID=3121368 RepID=A0AA95EYX1_9BACL|nr:MAG: phosphodiester glycosidase family protein [Cohnella sp.]
MQPKKSSKIWIPVIAGVLVLATPLNVGPSIIGLPSTVAYAATTSTTQAVTYKLVKQSETIVTSGARQFTYAWVPSDSTKATEMLRFIEIDLTNPYVSLDAMSGKGGSVTTKQSVMSMAKETGAVAGINGDVFSTGSISEGAPMGAQIRSGSFMVSTSQLKGMYAFAVTKDNKALIDQFNFSGKVTAADGAQFELTGMNKSAYRTEPDNAYSHVNGLFIYTSDWTATERPKNSATLPTEALIINDVVTEVSDKTQITTPIPTNGYILRGHYNRDSGKFIKDHLKVGDQVTKQYQLQSQTTQKVYAEGDLKMMVSGHTLLLDNGVAANFTRDINGLSGYADRARTAVGYSKDGNTAYLITVEENGTREGVSLKELQQMLLELGIWKAVNLDGGGSTTMVSRPLGEFQLALTHPTFYGVTQRLVANGIGVYSTAPKGEIKGITASGPQTLFIGQQASYSLKAYDTYYNPIDPTGLTPSWDLVDSLGQFQNGILQVSVPGKTTLNVSSGSATASLPLEVVSGSQIQQLIVEPSTALLQAGGVISMPVKAILTDGRELSVPAESITWEFKGFTGSMNNGKLNVNNVKNNIIAGYAIARYDGFGSVAVLSPGTETLLENFEQSSNSFSFQGAPAQTLGTATIATGVTGRESSKVLSLTYDFNVGAGKRYAYAMINNGAGIAINGNPGSMTLDVLGDKSMNWLRAEALDANGKIVYLTIANQIDWTGWKNIRVDLATAGLKGPAKLTKLYVVSLEEDQDEREKQGEIAFDNISLQYPPQSISVYHPTIVMKVGDKKATVDGTEVTLPGAPFMQAGTNTNYLPLRFVADRLGAEVSWNNTEKKVTVLRGDTMLELWVGRNDMVVNGVRKSVLTPPILVKNSVYVPVRVISEQLGQKVGWVGKTKTITIH